MTIACVPLLALSSGLLGAGLLYNGERFGKAVRTPARDTMLAHARVAVADFVPAHRRGVGYGTFTAIYGLAWLAGAAVIGALYDHGITGPPKPSRSLCSSPC